MRLSIGLVAVLLSVAFLTGPAAAQSKSDLTVALSSFSTEVLDPVLGGHVVKYYMSLMFDYLVGVTPDGQLSKDSGLATRWEPSTDHKRWTFYLRKGVRFHTGEEATSEDVKFSLQRAIGKRSTTGYAGPLRTLIADIETPAPDRLVIVTKEPTLIVPTYLSRSLSTEGMILPKKYIEATGDDAFAQKPVGSGPYRFVEQVTGSHIKLAAVDNHWRIGVPRYKTVTFKLVPEETTRIALLRRGEVDITDVSRERVKELEREAFPIHFRREEAILTTWWILPRDGQPTKDKRVREALNLAVDRNEIAQSIFAGHADPAYVPMGLSWAYRDIGFKVTPEMQYPYDPGAFGYYNVANRDWIGAYAFLEKQGYSKSKASDTVNDPEIDGMIEQVMRQTDKEKIATLMRNVYTRLRSEHYGVPVVYLHSPYAASKTLGKWNPGTVMYDFFLDELASSKR